MCWVSKGVLILLLKFWALVAIERTVVMSIFFFDILATGTEISVQFGTEEEEQLHTFCTHVGVLFNLSSILYFVIADNYF